VNVFQIRICRQPAALLECMRGSRAKQRICQPQFQCRGWWNGVHHFARSRGDSHRPPNQCLV